MYGFPAIAASLAGVLSILASTTSAHHIGTKHEPLPVDGIHLVYPAAGVDSEISFPIGLSFDYRDKILGLLFYARYTLFYPNGVSSVLTSYNNLYINSTNPQDTLGSPLSSSFSPEYPFWNGTRSVLTESCRLYHNAQVTTLVKPSNMTGTFKARWEMAFGVPSYVDREDPAMCNGTYTVQRITEERSFDVVEAKTKREMEVASATIAALASQPTGVVYAELQAGAYSSKDTTKVWAVIGAMGLALTGLAIC